MRRQFFAPNNSVNTPVTPVSPVTPVTAVNNNETNHYALS